MKEHRWTQILLAAVIIAIAGCVIAVAETVDVEVEVDDGNSTTVEIKTDNSVDVFTVDDLADGEERIFSSNDHTITVRRSGDEITVLMDGETLDGGDDAMVRKMILIAEDEGDDEQKVVMIEENDGHKIITGDHDEKNIKIRKGDGGEGFVWHGGDDLDSEEILLEMEDSLDEAEMAKIKSMLEGGFEGHSMMFFGDDDEGDMVKVIAIAENFELHGPHDGKIRYRCEETGSVLLVDPEYATQETLVDPAGGCLMTKVTDEAPEVIMIKKKVTVISED